MSAVFLNTDLILKARFDLRPLVDALTSRGLVLLGEITVKGGVWRATLESNLARPTLERAANRLLEAVENLGEAEHGAWLKCLSRCFDFGYECGSESFDSTSTIGNPLLARIAGSGATVAITIHRSSGSTFN